MRSQLDRYKKLARRWAWIIVVGIVICGGASLILSKLTSTVYQASTTIIITVNASSTSTDTTASIAAVPTYAQLLINPLVLEPVLAKHPGMTLQQLTAMMTVTPQVNTQLIELYVQNHDPRLAAQLADEIGQSFEHYSEAQLPASIQIWPAQIPIDPIKPKPLQDAGIGAAVGLGLAVALIIIFEWIDDRPTSPEEVQELLGAEILTVIPEFSDNQRGKMPKQKALLVERYRMLCTRLGAAQKSHPFKLVMITSAIGGEGKSTVSANLASFLAMTGKRVLLVDANLRHPVLDQHFQLNNQRGLSTVFLEMWTQPRAELYGQETSIPALRVLTAGMTPARPAELLQSSLANGLFEHFKHAPFDFIIFDTPPLLPIADAQIMASLVEAIVVVVDSNKTSRRMLARTRRVLAHSHARILGAAVNKSSWLNDSAEQQYPNPTQRSQKEPFMLIDPASFRNETIMYAGSPPGIEAPSSTPSPWGGGVIPDTPRPLIRPPFSRNEITRHD